MADPGGGNEYMSSSRAECLSSTPTIDLSSITIDVDNEWNNCRFPIYEVAKDILGTPKRRYRDLFDENADGIYNLLATKNKACHDLLSNPQSAALRANWNPTEPNILDTILELLPAVELDAAPKFSEILRAVKGLKNISFLPPGLPKASPNNGGTRASSQSTSKKVLVEEVLVEEVLVGEVLEELVEEMLVEMLVVEKKEELAEEEVEEETKHKLVEKEEVMGEGVEKKEMSSILVTYKPDKTNHLVETPSPEASGFLDPVLPSTCNKNLQVMLNFIRDKLLPG
ncbi:hypothetical protein Hamer_G000951 [Homarus americanus]|uniref:Uncharacterized protein n=1 Tax=Homarus americanus TaxID=6706 RepID=A0A8J5T274_HOMAM|nr:hypothetical protein Hamer_G000951 [Homarus americanus]